VGNHGVAAAATAAAAAASTSARGNGVAAMRQRCGGAGASKRGKEGRPSMK